MTRPHQLGLLQLLDEIEDLKKELLRCQAKHFRIAAIVLDCQLVAARAELRTRIGVSDVLEVSP